MSRLLTQDLHRRASDETLDDRTAPRAAGGTGPSSEPVLWLDTCRVFTSCGHELVLVVQGFSSGFQIWDLTSTVAREIASSRTGDAVRCASLIGPWTAACGPGPCAGTGAAGSAGAGGGGKRARLAVTSSARVDAPPQDVRVFDLDAHRYTHVIACGAEVHGTAGGAAVLAIALAHEVRVHAAASLRELFRVRCCPQPLRGAAVLALGARWLAVQAEQAPTADAGAAASSLPHEAAADAGGSGGGGSSGGSGAGGSMTELAQGLMVGLYRLRGVGSSGLGLASEALSVSLKKAAAATGAAAAADSLGSSPFRAAATESLSSHDSAWNGSDGGGGGGGSAGMRASPEKGAGCGGSGGAGGSAHAAAGAVAVVDTCEGRAVAHFWGHREPLAALAFSTGGRLLASAPASGQTLVRVRERGCAARCV
ncbi:hypothetical protein JKP88DRAFT_175905 [Tribonema minus]|uniref:Uncharacterized protein n=1 Tax=Tribonema minus TaxID=303371 RepID=A0A835ZBU8_9STRA|nr:hypothetical protein JKP88DRAFT_175905 [Tribonema minus]